MLFSPLGRRDGKGAINAEELFADDCPFASEAEREREDELRTLMSSIIDWAISFLSKANQASIRAIFYEGKTVKERSTDEVVTVYAVYRRLGRSYPAMHEVILEEIDGLDPETRTGFTVLFGIGGCDEWDADAGCPTPADAKSRPVGKRVEVRVPYTGECGIEGTVSRYLAACQNARTLGVLGAAER